MKLPNVMCIGASKSGTTSLYNILRQHSNVYVPTFKEPHFFDIPESYNKGLDWYKRTYFNNTKSKKCIIDFTPTYLFEKLAPERIYNDLGSKVKFIVLLRNPVTRSFSQYLHSKRDMHETLSFKDALSEENQRMMSDNYLSKLRYSYVNQGLYYKMLSNYFNFFSKENFLIIHFEEEFVAKRKETIDKIFSFLQIGKEDININLQSNPASYARFKWLKRVIRKEGSWRSIIKKLIPSVKIRQIIKNNLQRINIIEYNTIKLSEFDKISTFEKYFKNDVALLEDLINRKMNWEND